MWANFLTILADPDLKIPQRSGRKVPKMFCQGGHLYLLWPGAFAQGQTLHWTGASHEMWPWALKSANSNRQHPATSCNIYCGLFWWALQLFLWARASCWTQPSPTFEMAKCCHRVPNLVQRFPFLHFFQGYLLLATASKAPWLWHWFVIVLVWNSDIFSGSWSILCHLPMFSGTFSIRTALLWYIAATEQRWRLPLS